VLARLCQRFKDTLSRGQQTVASLGDVELGGRFWCGAFSSAVGDAGACRWMRGLGRRVLVASSNRNRRACSMERREFGGCHLASLCCASPRGVLVRAGGSRAHVGSGLGNQTTLSMHWHLIGRPSISHFLSPPSSTRTSGWPCRRSAHQNLHRPGASTCGEQFEERRETTPICDLHCKMKGYFQGCFGRPLSLHWGRHLEPWFRFRSAPRSQKPVPGVIHHHGAVGANAASFDRRGELL